MPPAGTWSRWRFGLTAHERGYPLLTCAAQNVVATADELAKLVATASADRTEFARTNMRYENVADELTDAILVNITTRVVGSCSAIARAASSMWRSRTIPVVRAMK